MLNSLFEEKNNKIYCYRNLALLPHKSGVHILLAMLSPVTLPSLPTRSNRSRTCCLEVETDQVREREGSG